MTRPNTRQKSHEDGAAAVEFALIVGILIMIVFAILEYGRMYSQYLVLQSAAREGARVAAVRGTDLEIEARIVQAASGFQIGPGIPAADHLCTDLTIGQPVTVSWTQDFRVDIPLLPATTKTVTVKGVFRCE
ncbi:MAG: pilus assembly protein [Acidobacteria bacterium]|nr:pilus assembly protein [Acidobacteriota bacterium]